MVDWRSVLWLIGYVALLGAGLFTALQLSRSRSDVRRVLWVAWLLSAIAWFGGLQVAVQVIPDWDPFGTIGLFLPFWALGSWSAAFVWARTAEPDSRSAALRSVRYMIPAMFLAPFSALLWRLLFAPCIAALALVVVLRRRAEPCQSEESLT